MSNIYKLAKKYYPKLWNRAYIDMLYEKGKLTEEEYRDVVGEE